MTNNEKNKDLIQVENTTDIFYKGFMTGYGLALITVVIAILLYSKYLLR